jgi:Tfp pilus assembly protein PilF
MDCRTSLLLAICLSLATVGCTTTDTPVMRGAAPAQTPPPPTMPQTTVPHPPKTMSEAEKNQSRIHIYMEQANVQAQLARTEKDDQKKAEIWDRVRKTYHDVIELDRKYLPAYQKLAHVYVKMGDKERALETINKALAITPRDPNLLYDQAVIFGSRKDWKQAENSLFNALQTEPENRTFLKQLGLTLAMEGQIEQSIGFLTRVYNGPAYAHYRVAQVLFDAYQDEACKQHLRMALEANPNLQEARDMLYEIEHPVEPRTAQASTGEMQSEGPRIFVSD